MEKLIVIYDFDGTLTPYSMPQYEVIKKCGYDDLKLMQKVKEQMVEGYNLYEAYIRAMDEILKEHKIERTMESLCLGAETVCYNEGVLEYFKELQSENIIHYVVTSGYEDYIRKTIIMPYLKDVFGSTIRFQETVEITNLMTDEKKVEAIKKIEQLEKVNCKSIIYVGDGLTDQYAFQYVKENGGTAIFVGEENQDLKKKVDYFFKKEFGLNSDMMNYIKSRLQKCN